MIRIDALLDIFAVCGLGMLALRFFTRNGSVDRVEAAALAVAFYAIALGGAIVLSDVVQIAVGAVVLLLVTGTVHGDLTAWIERAGAPRWRRVATGTWTGRRR